MIHITIFQDKEKEPVGFETAGHAEYAAEGCYDVLCAGVSMLVINTINAIETFTDDRFTQESAQEDARISFRIEGEAGKESRLLLKTMILGLETLQNDKQYKDFIDIRFEEVSQP